MPARFPTLISQPVTSVPAESVNLADATLRYVAGHQLMRTHGVTLVVFLCVIAGQDGYGYFDRATLAEHGDKIFAHLIVVSVTTLLEIKQHAGDDAILENLIDAAIQHRIALAMRAERFEGYQISINCRGHGLCPMPVRGNDTIFDVKRRYGGRLGFAVEEMKLIFSGLELENHFQLKDCGLFHRATLTLQLRLNSDL